MRMRAKSDFAALFFSFDFSLQNSDDLETLCLKLDGRNGRLTELQAGDRRKEKKKKQKKRKAGSSGRSRRLN